MRVSRHFSLSHISLTCSLICCAAVLFPGPGSAKAAGQAATAPVVAAAPDVVSMAAPVASMRAGRWGEAEAQLRHLLIAEPNSPAVLYLLGETLFHENQPRESLNTFTQAARLARPSALALRLVALDYVLLNDYDDAATWIARSLRDNPADGESWYDLGRIKYTQNVFGEAVQAFNEALLRLPRSVKVENNLGLVYEGMNRPEDALRCYRQAIAWDSANPHPSEQPRLNLGILLADRGATDEALPLLREAEAISPGDSRIHAALGKVYSRQGALAQAQTELQQAIAADPGDSGLHFQLGQVYRRQGMADRAATELKLSAEIESRQRR